MVKLGNLKIGEKTHIVGVIPGEEFLKNLQSSFISDVDILELRIDRFDNLEPNLLIETIKNLSHQIRRPLLATIRREEENDFKSIKHQLSEKQRLNLFKQIIPFVDGIDIELQAKEIIRKVINFAKKRKKTIIISYHNYKETPENKKLELLVREAKAKGADIIKIATYAKDIDDVARLMCFTYQCPQKPLASIPLGKIGTVSRIIGSVFGSCLTYGFIGGEKKYGQLSLNNLIKEVKKICP